MSPRTIRMDPWEASYGGSVDIEDGTDVSMATDFGVEPGPWTVRTPPPLDPKGTRCAFIDGVRRVDARLFVEEDGISTPALAGSWAVGVAWNSAPPRIDRIRVGHELISGGGLGVQPLDVALGQSVIRFTPSSVPDATLQAPLQSLQTHMREAEAALALDVFTEGAADLLVIDGPLAYVAPNGAAIGFVKRQSRAYLDVPRSRIFGDLARGSRTPVFALGSGTRTRYTWYMRMAVGRHIDGLMTGVARCEVSTQVGVEAAIALADRATALLPAFASEGWRDPRAPQNLYPVGALEARLTHMLGDAALVRRAFASAIGRSLGPSSSLPPTP